MEMELEALKRGSDKGASVAEGGQAADLAAALKEQTEALKEALSARGGSNSITTVKTDLVWPTLTDDKSDTKDVVLFYEEFEDVCALANNCRGMSAREKLLALRARCKGSRAKTYTNAYRAAWKTGEVTEDPEAVYLRIKKKNKHLMFGESREEREVRIDGEHQALVKGRLSGHQFEPLFEASVADLESVGLGKTPRELYLSYLRKMPPHLQKEIRQDKRIWPGLETPRTWVSGPLPRGRSPTRWSLSTSNGKHRAVAHSTYSTTAGEAPDSSAALAKAQKEIRELKAAAKAAAARPSGAAAKEESHKVVLEYEQREAAHRAVAHSTYSTTAGEAPDSSAALAKAQKEIRELKAAAKAAAARPSGAAAKDSTLAAGSGAKGGGKGAASKICFHFRDHGNCPKGDSCPFSHDNELRKQALAAKRGESTLEGAGGPAQAGSTADSTLGSAIVSVAVGRQLAELTAALQRAEVQLLQMQLEQAGGIAAPGGRLGEVCVQLETYAALVDSSFPGVRQLSVKLFDMLVSLEWESDLAKHEAKFGVDKANEESVDAVELETQRAKTEKEKVLMQFEYWFGGKNLQLFLVSDKQSEKHQEQSDGNSEDEE
ncbi:hypothetical protein AK812_SmicGene31268 [Symbiodinium microadriaticum]|uniref:C3H1-type domain-containing protein n=1 Tax=Symbiodinium microadriaticum TaxID=2951 RepID=A0A1Q9CX97_SYMMI|nr:hypothetical protein AK812_SmicGene31268 [Symbiodinium microadriaticum]